MSQLRIDRIDGSVLQLLLLAVTDWFDRRERQAVAYLIEEHCLLSREGCFNPAT
jgi:hypothetical protein